MKIFAMKDMSSKEFRVRPSLKFTAVVILTFIFATFAFLTAIFGEEAEIISILDIPESNLSSYTSIEENISEIQEIEISSSILSNLENYPEYQTSQVPQERIILERDPVEIPEPITTETIEWESGYATNTLDVYTNPAEVSVYLTSYGFGDEIQYANYDDEWCYILYEDTQFGYALKDNVSDEYPEYRSIHISSSGFKSYMSYKAITKTSSPQWKIQHNFAYTGEYGIRMVGDRFCIAVGTGVGGSLGDYIDLVLANGEIIPCIISDRKANCHTYDDNITSFNSCVSEFLIDNSCLDANAKQRGNISYCKDEWNSPVVEFRRYNTNIWD